MPHRIVLLGPLVVGAGLEFHELARDLAAPFPGDPVDRFLLGVDAKLLVARFGPQIRHDVLADLDHEPALEDPGLFIIRAAILRHGVAGVGGRSPNARGFARGQTVDDSLAVSGPL
jgi:hypothetical protein